METQRYTRPECSILLYEPGSLLITSADALWGGDINNPFDNNTYQEL